MLIAGSARSATSKATPPERWARNSAVAGSICISPSAPVGEVRASNFVSAKITAAISAGSRCSTRACWRISDV